MGSGEKGERQEEDRQRQREVGAHAAADAS
jgi:hypothetical protein